MSVVPSVHVTGYEVPEVILAMVTGVVALIAGAAWWHLAERRTEREA
jgi:hypothetical protein